MNNNFFVRWEMVVTAETPEEAAREAISQFLYNDDGATCVDVHNCVYDKEIGEYIVVARRGWQVKFKLPLCKTGLDIIAWRKI